MKGGKTLNIVYSSLDVSVPACLYVLDEDVRNLFYSRLENLFAPCATYLFICRTEAGRTRLSEGMAFSTGGQTAFGIICLLAAGRNFGSCYAYGTLGCFALDPAFGECYEGCRYTIACYFALFTFLRQLLAGCGLPPKQVGIPEGKSGVEDRRRAVCACGGVARCTGGFASLRAGTPARSAAGNILSGRRARQAGAARRLSLSAVKNNEEV